MLKTYKISASHQQFYRCVTWRATAVHARLLAAIPRGTAPANSYGIAVHAGCSAYDHLRATGSQLPEEDVIHEFEHHLERTPLTDDEHRHYMQQGSDALHVFLTQKYHEFT